MPICEIASTNALEGGRVGKDHMADFRDECSEYGGAKNYAGQQLSEDGGLPKAAHPLPKHAANEEQEDQFGRKNCCSVLRRHGHS
jgi:hypothetical protein